MQIFIIPLYLSPFYCILKAVNHLAINSSGFQISSVLEMIILKKTTKAELHIHEYNDYNQEK